MATKKREVIITKSTVPQALYVYADPSAPTIIAQVEGVLAVYPIPGSFTFVVTDPRYDIDEIIADIENAIEAAIQDQTAATIAEAEEVIR